MQTRRCQEAARKQEEWREYNGRMPSPVWQDEQKEVLEGTRRWNKKRKRMRQEATYAEVSQSNPCASPGTRSIFPLTTPRRPSPSVHSESRADRERRPLWKAAQRPPGRRWRRTIRPQCACTGRTHTYLCPGSLLARRPGLHRLERVNVLPTIIISGLTPRSLLAVPTRRDPNW
jgi:hypothetical protein